MECTKVVVRNLYCIAWERGVWYKSGRFYGDRRGKIRHLLYGEGWSLVNISLTSFIFEFFLFLF